MPGVETMLPLLLTQAAKGLCSYQDVQRWTAEAPAAHKETAHYLKWRETVADMMAEPRQARKFSNIFPTTVDGWDYPATLKVE